MRIHIYLYKTNVLPLHYTPIDLAPREGFEPSLTVLETAVLPLDHRDKTWYQVQGLNLRPTDYRSAALPTELTWYKNLKINDIRL